MHVMPPVQPSPQDAPLRVLIINTLYPPQAFGGAEKSVQFLAQGLAAIGHETTVLSIRPGAGTVDQMEGGVRTIYVPMRNLYFPWPNDAPHSTTAKAMWHMLDMMNPAMAQLVEQTIASVRPQIIHTNNLSGFSTLAWSKARAAGIPVAHTLRDYWMMCPRATMFRDDRQCSGQCMDCRLMSLPRRVQSHIPLGLAGVSQHMVDVHVDAGYFPRASVQRRIINPTGRPGDGFVRRPLPPRNGVRIGFMGALHPSKGLGRLLDAVAKLPDQGWSLVIAGRGEDSYVQEIRDRTAGRPIELLGFVDADTFYSQVDVVVIPSLWDDPMPRIVLESFVRGLPIVASRRGGIVEMVTHGVDGFLFEPLHATELEDCLTTIIASPDSLVKIAEAGALRVTERTGVMVAGEYTDFYRAVIQGAESRQEPKSGSQTRRGWQPSLPAPPIASSPDPIAAGRHVALINHLYDPDVLGGAEVMVKRLADALRDRGMRVSVVTTGATDSHGCIDGVDVHRLKIPNFYWLNDKAPRTRLQRLGWRMVNLYNPLAARRIGALLDRLKPDVVHTHNIVSFSPMVWSAAKKRGLPVVHTAHDYHLLCPHWSLRQPNGRLCTAPSTACRAYRQWHVGQASQIDSFCAPSRFLLAQHKPHLRPGTMGIHLPNGVPATPAPSAEQLQIGPGPLRFLLLSQLLASKGVETVLEAMRLIPADIALQVDIAGRGPLEAQVRAAAAQDPRIICHGFVGGQCKDDLLARSHVLLFPSLWYENGPYALMEAAAAGLALLGSNIGSLPEFIEDGRNGHLFPPGDAAALAGHMVAMARDPAAVVALRHASVARAPRYHDRLMVDGYLSVYDALLRASPQPAGKERPIRSLADARAAPAGRG